MAQNNHIRIQCNTANNFNKAKKKINNSIIVNQFLCNYLTERPVTRPPINPPDKPTIKVTVQEPKIQIVEIGETVRLTCSGYYIVDRVSI